MTKVQQATILYKEARASADELMRKCSAIEIEVRNALEHYSQLSSQSSALFNEMSAANKAADAAFDAMMEAMREATLQAQSGTQVRVEEN